MFGVDSSYGVCSFFSYLAIEGRRKGDNRGGKGNILGEDDCDR